ALDRGDAGFADVDRSVEIGLSLRQRDDVTTGRGQLGGERGDRHGRRGLYASEAVGEKGHDGNPEWKGPPNLMARQRPVKTPSPDGRCLGDVCPMFSGPSADLLGGRAVR